MTRKTEIDLDAVFASVTQSSKYNDIHPDTIRRAVAWAARRSSSEKEAIKTAKRKLHQVFAAFLPRSAKQEAQRLVQRSLTAGVDDRLDACRAILALHASTAERLAILDDFGALLRSLVPANGAILDIACGFNPFALPLWRLGEGVRYLACDVDCALMEEVDRFLKAINPVNVGECRDVIVAPPTEEVDVALLLKSVTTLEQEEKGAAASLIAAIAAPIVVVSFPTRSLGGRNRGMEGAYRSMAASLFAGQGTVEERLIGTELFFLLRKSCWASATAA